MPKKILLADDSITIQKVISITFASEDYDLIIVGDGDAAVAKIKEVKPDLIVADVAMPGKTGYEVCEIIKQDPGLRHIPVILLSGTFEPLNDKEARRVKADDHIVKPFESQELIEKVKNLLAKPPAPAVPAEPEKPLAAPEKKAPLPADIWEVGDFMGTEESDAAAKAGKDIWAVDFGEEPPKAAPKKPKAEEEFIELELKEEELQPIEEAKPVPPPPPSPKAPPVPPATRVGEEWFEMAPSVTPPPAAPQPVIPVAEKVEAKVKEAFAGEVAELAAISKDKLEEVIRKISREVIEEIAWEVIPDLAEELIKEEVMKIREAIAKTK